MRPWIVGLGLSAVLSCEGSGGGGAPDDTTGSSGDGDPGSTLATTTMAPGDGSSSGGDAVDDTSTGGDDAPPCVPVDLGGPAEPGDCGAGCAMHGFDVEHLSGFNYASHRVHLLSPACEGSTCPDPLANGTYGTEPIVPCEETPEALASPRGPEAYCRLAPITITFGFEIGFTEPPDPASITVVRPGLADPQDDEPYAWRTGIVQIQGPATDYHGHYVRGGLSGPDVVTGARNLACLENLDALGIPYDPDDPDAACLATFAVDGQTVPMRMRVDDLLLPTRGRLDSRTLSCSTPSEGPDTCCSACDHELSVAVAKYGIDDAGGRRSPNAGTAIACDPDADRLVACRDFVPDVDRTRETRAYAYDWDGCAQAWPLPRYDKVRETHPGDRPAGAEPAGAACTADTDCEDGQECVGTDDTGAACKAGASCDDRRCIAEWFVACRSDPFEVLAPSWCVDTRHRNAAAGACLTGDAPFQGVDGTMPAGSRLATCDTTADGNYTVAECCQDALGAERACDPLFQSGVSALPRHDRDPALPPTALCACTDEGDQPASCDPIVATTCAAPIGTGTDPGGASEPGEYALRAVARQGGVRHDPELDGFALRIAAAGNLERALTEHCAEQAGLVGPRAATDGWLAHDNEVASLDADFDRAMCSSSTYVLHFSGPDDPEHVVSASGDTLAGKQQYVFTTSDFLVVPGSGFPTDNLNVATCETFSLRFSNKYDLSLDNQRKISIWLLEDQAGEWVPVQRIAGGRDCDPDATPGDVQLGAIPCLVVDVGDRDFGEIGVAIDLERYGELLQVGSRYRIEAPGLDDPADIDDPVAYAEAFHDACGMPLVSGDLPEPEYGYDVTIDSACP